MVGESQHTQGARIKAWMARHYIASVVIASISSLMIGIALAGSGGAGETAQLRADIAEMQDDAAQTKQDGEDQIASLNDTITVLNEKNSDLSSANEANFLGTGKAQCQAPDARRHRYNGCLPSTPSG